MQEQKVTRKRWTAQEDEILLKEYNNDPLKDWKVITMKFNQKTQGEQKTQKQCRERWKINLSRSEKIYELEPGEKKKIVLLYAHYRSSDKIWAQMSSECSLPRDVVKNICNGFIGKTLRKINTDFNQGFSP